MLTMLFTFFTSSIGKYVGYGLIILSIVGLAYGYIKSKEDAAVAQATASYNAAQLQAANTQIQQYQAEINSLNTYTQNQTAQITTLQAAVDSLTQSAQTVITNSKDGTTLDPIFNQTLNALRGGK